MGRKGGNKKRFNKNKIQGQDGRKVFKGEEGFSEWAYNHPIFEAYYKLQFEECYFKENKDEFTLFWNMMKEKLPVVFRINKLTPNYEVFLNNIKDKDLIQKFIEAKRKMIEEQNQQKENAASTAIEVEGKSDQQPIEEEVTALEQEEKPKTDEEAEQKEENSADEDQDDEENQEGQAAEGENKGNNGDGPRIQKFEFNQQEIDNLQINNIKFYPDELVWQVNCNRTQLKKSILLKEFHKYIQRANDSGLISRQELVSMLPPLMLDVKPDDIIFDMCAAPGSKTAQLLELMCSQGVNAKGAVVANDVDQKRAYLLTHQVCRINPSGLIVINHPAQFFPRLQDPSSAELVDKRFYFDKVQADVPCSGDGATRKIPTQWRNWTTRDGQVLHPLQLAILQRALTMCKVGGYVLYSTCSINPIEDEAVITEAFRRAPAGSFELIDIHAKYPEVKGRRGMSSWKVCASLKKHPGHDNTNNETIADWLKFYDNFEAIEKGDKTAHFIRESMFPDTEERMLNEIKIQNTMRILPHDQDTGGFYLALIKKNADIKWDRKVQDQTTAATAQSEQKQGQQQEDDDDLPDASEIPKEAENLQNLDQGEPQEGNQKKKDKDVVLKENFVTISDEEWQNIQESYGFQGVEQSLFVVNTVGKQKVVRFITPGAKKFNDCDVKGVVNTINMGTKAFERSRETFQGIQCKFRICQDSVNLISPFMTKRKITVSDEDFKFFVLNKNAKYTEIPNQQLKEQIQAYGQGSIVLHCQAYNDNLVCQNFHQSVNIMTNKEITESFKIRYLQQLF